jgi:hypothetical protein
LPKPYDRKVADVCAFALRHARGTNATEAPFAGREARSTKRRAHQEDIQSLRKSIDATPAAAAALKAKGLRSSKVVAINVADGVLTMFCRDS